MDLFLPGREKMVFFFFSDGARECRLSEVAAIQVLICVGIFHFMAPATASTDAQNPPAPK